MGWFWKFEDEGAKSGRRGNGTKGLADPAKDREGTLAMKRCEAVGHEPDSLISRKTDCNDSSGNPGNLMTVRMNCHLFLHIMNDYCFSKAILRDMC